ncbi:sigma-54-dependent transcriptional regulator [Pseudodesulfovibrio tunisiensis]|uniref:sigma-54-dependent transcriptional regulator n=1 Tax=Pseudodesulfovibrio tunisiensis TaxID=463192 RepID=UPI001FB4A842|nr:sigma-54 dependent transcriptional regulator [Pseudodesulfovibrio tunisiensis]
MTKILIIDDDPRFSETMLRIMARMGMEAAPALTLEQARTLLVDDDFDLVFLDVRLPDGNGLDELPEILGSHTRPEVVILTGQGDPDGAELAIKAGAWDYLVKPSSVKQTMLCVERALKYRSQKRAAARSLSIDLRGLVGISPKMKACYDQLRQAAISSSNVLITGETGTGKELVARTIHRNSQRKSKDFVPVDCASLKKGLVESTLFGHKRGAFTGAEKDRIGLVKVADKGTLFLDEIGEMELPIQKAFLRVLQEHAFRPVGDTHELTSDFRLIAATNRDLKEDVARGEFRKDLLYRIKTIHIQLPPLRERPEDIKLLALYKVNRMARQYGKTKTVAPEFYETLAAHLWPGNVRELFAAVETAFIRASETDQLIPHHLPPEVRIAATKAQITEQTAPQVAPMATATVSPAARAVQSGHSLKTFKVDMESEYLTELQRATDNNIKEMARISGCSQSHLYALLKKAGISTK